MFPLRKRKLIRGAVGHVRAGLGIGADYVARYVNLYAPKNGIGTSFQGAQGGNWYRLRLLDGSRIEFAHLSKILKTGKIKEGDKIAVTGNTGKITTGPHLHIQIFNKKRLDPEKYAWGEKPVTLSRMKEEEYKNKIRELNTELGTVTRQRDKNDEYKERYYDEVESHGSTIDHLDGCKKELSRISGQKNKMVEVLKDWSDRLKNFFL